jgi:hypothetical protein
MRRVVRWIPVVAGIIALAPVAQAQNSCPTPASVQSLPVTDAKRITNDACFKASDFVQFLTPQFGIAQAGGNPTPSIGGTLGGFPHFNVGVRLTGVQAGLPRLDKSNPSLAFDGAKSSNIPVDNVILPMPTVDAQIGVFQGFKLGLPIPFLGITNILGLDALVNASYLPNASAKTGSSGFDLTGGKVAIGYGARLGIFEESFLAPGLSVSWVTRPSPTFSVAASTGNDTLALNNFKLTTTSWRATASKTIPIIGIGVSAGYGQDKLSSSSDLALRINEPAPIGSASLSATTSLDATRTNYFVGAHWKIILVRFAAEVGYVQGGTNPVLRNAFLKDGTQVNPMDKRMYASVAARIGL